jgi:collagenase-like PrtC family protease
MKNSDGQYPVVFPLGSDEKIDLEIIRRSRFAEYYTGLADETLHGCSMSQHFLPDGCVPTARLNVLNREIRANGSRLSVALNVVSFRTAWRPWLEDLVKKIADAGVHSVVVSHLGILEVVRSTAPKLAVHISSLAGATNLGALRFFSQAGADRVILPRSMTASEVIELTKQAPRGLEIEAFILGGGCAFAEHSCNLPHFLSGNGQSVSHLGPDALYTCLPHRPGCKSPALVKTHSGKTRVMSLHPGPGACGICYGPAFLKAGVVSLKATGRAANPADLLRLAALTENALAELTPDETETTADFIQKCVRNRAECLYQKEWPYD